MEYSKSFFFEGNNQVCLLIHGYTGTPGHMRYLGEFLHNKGGYTVSAPLLPGHGTTLEEMERCDENDWLNAIEEEYKKLSQKYDKIYLLGLSMGGVLSLILAENYQVNKVVSISAPIKIHNKLAYLTPVLKHFKRFDGDKTEMIQNKEDEYDIYYGAKPLKTVPSLLKLMRIAKNNLEKITAPTLVIQSDDDRTVKPESAKIIYEKISSKNKEILWLDTGGHVVTINDVKEQIHQKILDFLEE